MRRTRERVDEDEAEKKEVGCNDSQSFFGGGMEEMEDGKTRTRETERERLLM